MKEKRRKPELMTQTQIQTQTKEPWQMTAAASDSSDALAVALKQGVEIKDRKYRLKTYKDCFVGREAVDFLVSSGMAKSRSDAVRLANTLITDCHVLEHVTRDHNFEDDYLFYRFIKENERGSYSIDEATGKSIQWEDFLAQNPRDSDNLESLQPKFPKANFEAISPKDKHVASQMWPLDEHNRELLDHVHPPAWKDPEPNNGRNSSHYDLVVIGAGSGGLVTAAGAAGVGARVALIEEHFLGGDCLNVGCVPSKSIIHAANLAHTLRGDNERLAEAGLSFEGVVKVDFEKVMQRVRKVRAEISHHDSASRFTKELGIELYIGRGKFAGERAITVNERKLTFKKAVVATGAYPTIVPIPGLRELYAQARTSGESSEPRPLVMTNETIFNLTKQPKNVVVIGAGVIGLELAQAMQRLGSSATVLDVSGKVLPNEDQDMSRLVKDQMVKDGVKFMLSVSTKCVESTGKVLDNGYVEMKVTVEEQGRTEPEDIYCDVILVATGRRPNVTGMDLEKANIEFDTRTGLKVNDRLQTTNSRVYGVGDCCTEYKFTHASDFMARAVIKNAFFFGKEKMSKLLIPYATFTSPEIASVGLYESDLKQKGIEFRIIEKHFKDNDRAICDDTTTGFVRFRVEAKSDKILGASIVGQNAGNMIGEITLAMQSGTGLGKLAYVIHPYPTTSEVLRQAGDVYNKTRLTNKVKQLLRGVIQLQS